MVVLGVLGETEGEEMKLEKDVWKSFKRCLPDGIMARRIEDTANLGTWDVIMTHRGGGAWIELKHTKTVGTKPKLRPGQSGFGQRLILSGTPGVYVVGDDAGSVRVLGRDYDGEDWKASLLSTWDRMEAPKVHSLCQWLGVV